MLIVLTSPDALFRHGTLDAKVASALVSAKKANNPVAIVSNHPKPNWFDEAFANSGVQFLQDVGRQSGKTIQFNAEKLKLKPFDVLVLAATNVDIQMGKNGGAVLVAAGWSNDNVVGTLGIRVDDAAQFAQVIALSSAWKGKWWFSADTATYNVRALADLSKYLKPVDQQVFAQKVTTTVKNGGPRLNALLAVTARSILTDETTSGADLWGVYPSSNSANNDKETLSDFTHRLRTTVSRVRFAERDHPLFIRHKPSQKRSTAGGGIDRTDPTDQLLTVHLNPHYKGRVRGRRVVVIDDCVTYGVSFGVAGALLRAAQARTVTGVALGKFGNQLHQYEISIKGDPYAPLASSDFKVTSVSGFAGTNNDESQSALLELIP